jgi:hypothetical protein
MSVALLSGFRIPGLGDRAIRGNFMSATMHSAKSKHRADMALLGSEFIQIQRSRVVASSTAAIEVKLRQGDARLGNARRRRTSMPCAGFYKIGRNAASLSEHEPIPVLCPGHGVGGFPQPDDGLMIVTLTADAAS